MMDKRIYRVTFLNKLFSVPTEEIYRLSKSIVLSSTILDKLIIKRSSNEND